MSRAFFGRPETAPVRGGAHVTLYLVPVFERQLVAFDVSAPQARGRWLPWTVLDFGQNPYEAAAGLADRWCGGRITDLALVDVMSFEVEGGGWELAIVFRAELSRLPEPTEDQAPHVFAEGHFDAIGRFDPVDLERWVRQSRQPAAQQAAPPANGGMIF
ncbi:MAG: hypothetical protein M0R74_02285 [Dehalococcoidia bacterium]|nr:hypothetical protein [Dehalococcoidia bacterium]